MAIKVLPEYWSRDPERLRRFEQEAQSTAALKHPNIVSIFYVGQYDGSPYIVTELLQGETVRDRLRKGPMRLPEVRDHGVELARGLAAAQVDRASGPKHGSPPAVRRHCPAQKKTHPACPIGRPQQNESKGRNELILSPLAPASQ